MTVRPLIIEIYPKLKIETSITVIVTEISIRSVFKCLETYIKRRDTPSYYRGYTGCV